MPLPVIADWRGSPGHATCVVGVRKVHGRTHRFWWRYDEIGEWKMG